ncbi:PREDICTED: dynactin subunit 4 isoform X1 [Trachymyrmex septentrionalis]|uniref:dynactin subunit 4 isoform X1 n=1 Tax=Trachymyrmex septentrionalis TaxID=34720 RepID=UPI00084F0EF3|nr:PREDICTED: dynactin subunit 4 isoform X1 [Trachymyrmex septentrionalis]
MTYLNQPDYVRYLCNCGSLKPISKIYFCRHCLMIRCGYCVCQEVDSHYCPNCMENLPSSEVRLKKNKCSNCFDCPCCFQTLSTRAGLAPVRAAAPTEGEENKDVKATPKKVYYLFCSLCRWSSRDAGIPDQSVATGGWPEQENPHVMRINALIDYHKVLASIEKQQCERKKIHPKRSFMPAQTMYSFTSALVRKRIGRPMKPPMQSQSSAQPVPSIASEEVDELSSDIFTESVDITKITTLEQRLQHPEVQAEKINELRPQHRQFLVKRSQRCRVCEHNVSKSDLCPQSTKFKILLAAFHHIPEVKIVTCEPLRSGKSSELLLKFCNPTQHQTQITILPLDTSLSTSLTEEKDVKQEDTQTSESSNLLPSTVRQAPVTEDPKAIKVVPNADLILPHSSLILPPRDDAAEYDDTNDNHNFQDDPKCALIRKGNKAVIRLHVIPHDTNKDNEDPIIVGFVMQHGYVNTIVLKQKSPQKVDAKVKLYLTVGQLVGET